MFNSFPKEIKELAEKELITIDTFTANGVNVHEYQGVLQPYGLLLVDPQKKLEKSTVNLA